MNPITIFQWIQHLIAGLHIDDHTALLFALGNISGLMLGRTNIHRHVGRVYHRARTGRW